MGRRIHLGKRRFTRVRLAIVGLIRIRVGTRIRA